MLHFACVPPEWGMNGKNGTSTEMIECIAHSGSILQMKYWRIYVIDILSVSKWKVDANALHLWVWSSFCWTMCMNMFILFYFRFNFASPWKWISFHIAFDPSNLMNGYMKKKSTAQINLLFIQRCVQWNVIQLEEVIQRFFLSNSLVYNIRKWINRWFFCRIQCIPSMSSWCHKIWMHLRHSKLEYAVWNHHRSAL